MHLRRLIIQQTPHAYRKSSTTCSYSIHRAGLARSGPGSEGLAFKLFHECVSTNIQQRSAAPVFYNALLSEMKYTFSN